MQISHQKSILFYEAAWHFNAAGTVVVVVAVASVVLPGPDAPADAQYFAFMHDSQSFGHNAINTLDLNYVILNYYKRKRSQVKLVKLS